MATPQGEEGQHREWQEARGQPGAPRARPLLLGPRSGPQAGRAWRCQGGRRQRQTRLLLECPGRCQADGRAQGTELRWGGSVSLEESPLELAFRFWFPQQSEPRNGFEKPQGDLSSLVPR